MLSISDVLVVFLIVVIGFLLAVKPGAKSDAKPDAKSDAKSDAKPDPKSDAEPDPKSDAKPDAKADESTKSDMPPEVPACRKTSKPTPAMKYRYEKMALFELRTALKAMRREPKKATTKDEYIARLLADE